MVQGSSLQMYRSRSCRLVRAVLQERPERGQQLQAATSVMGKERSQLGFDELGQLGQLEQAKNQTMEPEFFEPVKRLPGARTLAIEDGLIGFLECARETLN